MRHYAFGWEVDFVHVLVDQDQDSWTYRLEVDPALISASDVGKAEMKTAMRDHIESGSEYWEGSQVLSFGPNSITVQIPKNGPYQVANGMSDNNYRKLLRSDFSDIFKTVINIRRYHFSESDVDDLVNNHGGQRTVTAAQAMSVIIDRLDE